MGSDRKRAHRGLGIALVLVVQALAVNASAQVSAADRETARGLMEEGDAQYEKGEWGRALQQYRGAHALMQVPTTGIAVARVLVRMRRLVEARDMALQVERMPIQPGEHPVFREAREEARRVAAELEPRIPSLQVKLVGEVPESGTRIEIDGKELPEATALLPRKVNPGNYTITVKVEGMPPVKKAVAVEEGEAREVEVELRGSVPESTELGSRAPAERADRGSAVSSTSPLVYVGFGVGAGGVLVGTITGWIAKSKTSDLKDSCENATCPPSQHGDYDSANRMATISNISFGVGLVGMGLGVYGLMSGSSAEQSSRRSEAVEWRAMVGPGQAGVQGRF